MVFGILLVPPGVVGVDEPVPDMAVAIGAVHGSVVCQAKNPAVGKLGPPVQGIPRRGTERRVTGTGTNMPLHYRG